MNNCLEVSFRNQLWRTISSLLYSKHEQGDRSMGTIPDTVVCWPLIQKDGSLVEILRVPSHRATTDIEKISKCLRLLAGHAASRSESPSRVQELTGPSVDFMA